MPNAIAYLALLSWPAIAALLFRRLPVGRALIASLLAAYLLLPPLPAQFDFPMMPSLNKDTIPSLVALIGCLVVTRGQLSLLPRGWLARGLVLVFVLSPLATVLSNAEPVYFGRFALPGLRLTEAVGIMMQQGLLIAPFLLARALLDHDGDHEDLLRALLIGGLAYSLPMLLEVRLSPQINIWVYGYFQHNFEQMIRDGGFRPIVFLYHGLWVAFFAMTAVLAAVALARQATGRRAVLLWGCAGYLGVVLLLCKSMASLLYALALVPLLALLSRRLQLLAAVLLASLALGYPLLKGADLVPQDTILELAESVNPDRAHSLGFRLQNEEVLLERAQLKPVFGWGIWGRNHVLSAESGQSLTVTDGRWVIVLGMLGWVGFVAEFGLLALPVFLLWIRDRRAGPAPPPACATVLALLVAVNLVDLIPNATITPLTFLAAGAVLGLVERRYPRDAVAAQSAARRDPIRSVL